MQTVEGFYDKRLQNAHTYSNEKEIRPLQCRHMVTYLRPTITDGIKEIAPIKLRDVFMKMDLSRKVMLL